MLKSLVCGAVVFPGLFYSFRKVLKHAFKHWSDADVVSVSERLAAKTRIVHFTELAPEMRLFVFVLLIFQFKYVVGMYLLLYFSSYKELVISALNLLTKRVFP